MLYLRFVICLAAGLFGLVLLLSTVMETVLADWDVAADIKALRKRLMQRDRKRYVLIGEGAHQIRLGDTASYAEKQIAKQFLAPLDPNALQIPMPMPAGPALKRLDIFAPRS